MNDEERLNPGHQKTRALLRLAGPLLMMIGLVFTCIGFASFFAAFGNFESPRYFWCAFVGLPLLGLGGAITQFAYLGTFYRYFLGESAPITKDTFNYMAEGTQQGVRTLAAAVGDGLRGTTAVRCGQCGQENDADAKYCRSCGSSLAATCPSCHHANASQSRYCDMCGKPL